MSQIKSAWVGSVSGISAYYLTSKGWRFKVGTHARGRKKKTQANIYDKVEKKAILATRDVLVLALQNENWCMASTYGRVLRDMIGE